MGAVPLIKAPLVGARAGVLKDTFKRTSQATQQAQVSGLQRVQQGHDNPNRTGRPQDCSSTREDLRGGPECRPWPDRDVAIRLLLLKVNIVPCLQHQHFKEPSAGIQPGLACNNAVQASLQEHRLSEVRTCALLLQADSCTCASSLQ